MSIDPAEEQTVEIVGLEMLLQQEMPEDLHYLVTSLSDDDSSSVGSFDEDSLNLARGRRRFPLRRYSSNDSYANDSLEIARKNRIKRANDPTPKDTLPIEAVSSVPLTLKEISVDLKDIVPSSPALSTSHPDAWKRKRISNSAA